ncbi:MAG TPA: heparinase II/III family protein [Caulobacteraceae bacterium]|jgi:uncharacterized heparinase superfamily protein
MALLPQTWNMAFEAAERTVRRQAAYEWWGTPLHGFVRGRIAAREQAATPRDFRPADPERGREILRSRLHLAGALLDMGEERDPWDSPSPTKRFAEALHRFVWMKDLLALGDEGAREALRLALRWEASFGRWSPFAWSGEILSRRVFELACAARRLSAVADEEERAVLLSSLARQADHLIRVEPDAARAAEHACAAAVAGLALSGSAGERIAGKALSQLASAVKETVLADGGHRSRSPEAALELLLDLLTLDDVLLQRGKEAPQPLARALDRLQGAVRFFTLGDGRLACFQGGETSTRERVAAARLHDDAEAAKPFGFAPHSKYQRLAGRDLQVIIDAGPPAAGPWSVTACAQPLAIEVAGGGDRLITNGGWSPDASGPQAWRLSAAASTVTVAEGSPGAPLSGWALRTLGPRLVDGPPRVEARRNEAAGGVWIEVSHDGWVREFGLIHERRLFLDPVTDELRGEDRLAPSVGGKHAAMTPYAARFHLHPDVKATLARDGRSVLLTGPSGRSWWFRNDAAEITLEPSAHFQNGLPQRTEQIVLRGTARGERGGRVRWKISAAESPPA